MRRPPRGGSRPRRIGDRAGRELWAGYPAVIPVILEGPPTGRFWRHPNFAPLLIRRVDHPITGFTMRLLDGFTDLGRPSNP